MDHYLSMLGHSPSAPITIDKQNVDQRFSEIESQWEIYPANGGINSAGKWKCLERLAMLVKGSLVPIPASQLAPSRPVSQTRFCEMECSEAAIADLTLPAEATIQFQY